MAFVIGQTRPGAEGSKSGFSPKSASDLDKLRDGTGLSWETFEWREDREGG